MDFYLGTHQPYWLRLYDVPMMVSRRTLERYKTRPVARGRWFQDSGGFTELFMFGAWQTSAADYITETRRNAAEVGNMAHAAPMDWMCEPIMLEKTKLTIRKHQGRTVKNYLDLREKAPELPWVPVIQGWKLDDYLRCVEWYDRAGVDLWQKIGEIQMLVGVGTICRRQGTAEAAAILGRLAAEGLRLHAFGLKGTGIPNVAPFLASSDSLAWSYAARRQAPLPGCTTHKNCANCPKFALRWYAHILRQIETHRPAPYQTVFAF